MNPAPHQYVQREVLTDSHFPHQIHTELFGLHKGCYKSAAKVSIYQYRAHR